MKREIKMMSRNILEQGELSQEEWKDSQIYTCYDRTMYHYFERINHILRFKQLFLDRYLGFVYSESEEPILPLSDNGFDLIKQSFEVSFISKIEEIPDLTREWVQKGYIAHAPMKFLREDGTTITTSTLVEGFLNGQPCLTKTNFTTRGFCIPISMEEFIKKFPLDEQGNCEIKFLKADKVWLEDMKSLNFQNLINKIFQEKYNYSVNNGSLIHDGKKVFPENSALLTLKKYFEEQREEILRNGINKKNQFRMYNHIADKINPIINAWEEIVDNNIKEYLIIKENISNIRGDLKNLLKWFSLLYNKQNAKFYARYIKYLEKTIEDYSAFQYQVHKLVIQQLGDGND
ncbi:MAG TPA: hypothetical protein VGC17_08025 [Lactovum miscens]|uniref:hypothetical protein n=1 Tax=Lactovum miscens TaxID=190387 RepID=UPI002ED81F51